MYYDVLLSIGVYFLIMIVLNIINVHYAFTERIVYMIPRYWIKYFSFVWVIFRTISILIKTCIHYYDDTSILHTVRNEVAIFAAYICIMYVVFKVTKYVSGFIFRHSVKLYWSVYMYRIMKAAEIIDRIMSEPEAQAEAQAEESQAEESQAEESQAEESQAEESHAEEQTKTLKQRVKN
jgi:hypothetical protein